MLFPGDDKYLFFERINCRFSEGAKLHAVIGPISRLSHIGQFTLMWEVEPIFGPFTQLTFLCQIGPNY